MEQFPSNFSLEEMLHFGDFPEQLVNKIYELLDDIKDLNDCKYNYACSIEELEEEIEILLDREYGLQEKIDELTRELTNAKCRI